MTVSSQTSYEVVLGDGVTTTFSYTFPMVSIAYATLILTDISADTQTTIPQSQYAVTGVTSSTGGTFTYPLTGPAVTSGFDLTLSRILPYTQNVVIANQGAFYPQVVEIGLDNLEYQIQQVQAQIDNVAVPVGALLRQNNLSDVQSASDSRTNLGLKSLALVDAGAEFTTTSASLSLATTSVTAGSYTNTSLTVDSKGRVTAASSGTTSSFSSSSSLHVQTFTASGTFTVSAPATTTTLFEITVTAGGGAGQATTTASGGAGATGILYTSGFTTSQTIAVIVGAGGNASAGGTSSITIASTTYSAVGGTHNGSGNGGTATGFSINLSGGDGGISTTSVGGASFWGGGGNFFHDASAYGSGGAATNDRLGAGGIVVFKWVA